MSLSSSDCFSSSDLLCGEDSSVFCGDDSPEYASDLESLPPEFEDSIAELLEEERGLAGFTSRLSHEPIDASARAESVAWILKVQRYHGFHPLTAYISVNYFDCFLHSYTLPVRPPLPAKAKEIILSAITGASFIKYRPSCVAAAAALCAANDLQSLSFAESWRDGLHKDDIMSCYQIIREIISLKSTGTRQAEVIPQLRAISIIHSSDSSSSSSSPYKRRKLNNQLWEEEVKKGSG